MNATVIGLDPGRTTGVAIFSVQGGSQSFISKQVSGPVSVPKILAIIERWPAPIIVTYEKFIVTRDTGKRSRINETTDVIGAVIGYCATREFIDLESHTASEAKTACPDTRLRELGWYQPHMRHANDAARHIAVTLRIRFPAMWYAMIHQ